MRQVHEEHLAHGERQDTEAAEPERPLALEQPGDERREAERAPEAGERELRRLRRVLVLRAGQIDDQAAREVDGEPGADPGERLRVLAVQRAAMPGQRDQDEGDRPIATGIEWRP